MKPLQSQDEWTTPPQAQIRQRLQKRAPSLSWPTLGPKPLSVSAVGLPRIHELGSGRLSGEGRTGRRCAVVAPWRRRRALGLALELLRESHLEPRAGAGLQLGKPAPPGVQVGPQDPSAPAVGGGGVGKGAPASPAPAPPHPGRLQNTA